MNTAKTVLVSTALLAVVALSSHAQNGEPLSDEAATIIERILSVDSHQREAINDIVFDAEMLEGKIDDNGEFIKEARFVKKIYLKRVNDTTLIHEEYLEYYKNGELKSESELKKEASDRLDKKQKRKSKDISYSMITPFTPEMRDKYRISYRGVAPNLIDGHHCHHFRISATDEDDELINGDYYFETDGFQLVQVDFAPAKLVRKMMFKLKKLDMSIHYAESEQGFWLPERFEIEGKGKAALFVGVNFAAIETYRNPVINGGIDDSIFEVQDGK